MRWFGKRDTGLSFSNLIFTGLGLGAAGLYLAARRRSDRPVSDQAAEAVGKVKRKVEDYQQAGKALKDMADPRQKTPGRDGAGTPLSGKGDDILFIN